MRISTMRRGMAEKLSVIRRRLGLTQEDLAEVTGIRRETISRYENGHFAPTDAKRRKIAEALGVSADDITTEADSDGEGEGASEEHPSYVSSSEDKERWRDLVVRDRSIDDLTRVILMGLPNERWVDTESSPWSIDVTVDEYAKVTGRTREEVEEYLPKAVDSPYFERRGKTKYSGKLRFPVR